MCIRDRVQQFAIMADEQHGLGGLAQLGLQPRLPRNVEVVAVSYTHLRAHETVLDLVCRLLLEKNRLHRLFYCSTSFTVTPV